MCGCGPPMKTMTVLSTLTGLPSPQRTCGANRHVPGLAAQGRCNADPNSRSVTIMITDCCPECEADHLDIQALTFNKVRSAPALHSPSARLAGRRQEGGSPVIAWKSGCAPLSCLPASALLHGHRGAGRVRHCMVYGLRGCGRALVSCFRCRGCWVMHSTGAHGFEGCRRGISLAASTGCRGLILDVGCHLGMTKTWGCPADRPNGAWKDQRALPQARFAVRQNMLWLSSTCGSMDIA